MCGVTSDPSLARLATRSQILWKPRISFSAPMEAGNTSSPNRGSARSISQAACDRGRSDAPVFVSFRRAVRVTRSTSGHVSASASPRRQPESARKRAIAMAIGQVGLGHAAAPCRGRRIRHSSPDAGVPCKLLLDPMGRIVGAKALPDGIGEDNAQKRERPRRGPFPPVTRASPCFPVFTRAAVAPSLT